MRNNPKIYHLEDILKNFQKEKVTRILFLNTDCQLET